MNYADIRLTAEKWQVSERSVRKYCEDGRVPGSYKDGKNWMVPDDAEKPLRKQRMGKIPDRLLERLKMERENGVKGGIYHRIQIELTYNSNHMEGSRLSHDQTRYIYETNTIGATEEVLNVDDIIETANHFRCVDLMIDQANYMLSESFIKQLHFILKSGTSDSRKPWFATGDYKRLENSVGGKETTDPKIVSKTMKKLLKEYNSEKKKTLDEILEFHCRFEMIHPFQDGNGRIGRLIMFKECLRNGITPFIMGDDIKGYYYRGLDQWNVQKGYLRDTCLSCQDRFKRILDQYGINCE